MKPCGVCPACTGVLQGNTECDCELETRLVESLGDLFAILSDRGTPPPMPVRELARLHVKGAA